MSLLVGLCADVPMCCFAFSMYEGNHTIKTIIHLVHQNELDACIKVFLICTGIVWFVSLVLVEFCACNTEKEPID